VHPDPDHAIKDGPQSITPAVFAEIMSAIPWVRSLETAPGAVSLIARP
jgi:3-deoxy-D-arabino-heptulosonate 7-phosphate (DAHP) synthase